MTTKRLTAREREVLSELTDAWVRPMDIGGSSGSDHSAVLKQLAAKGLIERCRRGSIMNELGSSRGSYVYRNLAYVPTVATVPRVTRAEQALKFTRILASYPCAGIDQEPDDLTLCGKCGPCEAAAFLRSIGEEPQ